MAIKILLIFSIVLQMFATVVALRMIRKTKYSAVWIVLVVALGLMTAIRILQFIHFVPRGVDGWFIAMLWMDISISVCLAVVLFYAGKLVEHIDQLIFQRSLSGKRILSATLRTEEKERVRFSKELHDGLGPLLSSAKMSLSALSRQGWNDGDREIIEGTAYVIDEAIRSLREISNNLSPHVLNEFGLGRGVGNFLSRSAGVHNVKIDYRTNLTGERFDADVEVILYRVICELVNNSLKHSGASEVAIELNYDGRVVTLDYSDNGRGFDPEADGGAGMGLGNIASRINTLSGRLEIKSGRGEGMTARIEIDPDKKIGQKN